MNTGGARLHTNLGSVRAAFRSIDFITLTGQLWWLTDLRAAKRPLPL